jgi:RNA polymerase sigma-70 factor, ECF subfamily
VDSRPSPPRPAAADDELVRRLRAGEEEAFVLLAHRHQAPMLRLASSFVASTAVAEEVVQDTWLAVLRGLDGFEERSSFRTWLLRILVNRARTTGAREGRTVAVGDPTPAVDPTRFDAAGAWSSPPVHWVEESESRVFAEGLGDELAATLKRLPEQQRAVVLLRDVDGLGAEEVCEVLAISRANQRVLLHRGRSRLRRALERFVRV